MELKEKIEKAKLHIDENKIKYNEPMNKYTSFKIGGPAECLIKIDNEDDLKEILKFVKEENIKLTILGNGSNVLVLDKGIKGITLLMKIEKIEMHEEGNKVLVKLGAGEKIAKVGRVFLNKSLTGFEEISGIPGTIGGAVRMNAGAHGREMKDIVKTVTCFDLGGNKKVFTNEEMEFSYRRSIVFSKKYIITEVEIKLEKGKEQEIKEKMEEYSNSRKEKQPLEYPSAGSTFKRGEDFITAKLIDEAGLKGMSVGGAEISTKHAGFIINKNNATAKDVLDLVQKVKEEIYKKFGKNIELEIEILGE